MVKILLRKATLPFLLLNFVLATAQKTEMLYADSLQKKVTVHLTTANILHDGIYSYFPARAGNETTEINVLVKTDTSGKTLWTSYPLLYPESESNSYYRQYKRLIKGTDGDLYGLLENNRIIKVMNATGSVAWMKTVHSGNADYLRDQILDYDQNHFLFTRAYYNTGELEIIKVNKALGENADTIRLSMPSLGANFGGGRTYAIFKSGTNLLVSTKDTCFKYESFENPILLWKARHGIEFLQDVARIDTAGNQVLIFGNKYNGFQNGYITCLDTENGNHHWTCRNQGTFDVNYSDHKIKDGFIYTAWKHQYVGSTSERCLVHKVNLATGVIQWQHNHFYRTQPVSVAIQEGITQLLLDDEFIYLTGYAQPDNYDKKSWIFMKLSQSSGAVTAKSFIENSDPDRDYPAWFTMRFAGQRMYATGFHLLRNATISMDKTLQPSAAPKPIAAAVQHPSAALVIHPFSASKKIIIRRQGKQLLAEMTDPFYNPLWKYPIGNNIDFYEPHPQIFVGDSNQHLYIVARRYQYYNNDFFFYHRSYTDSLFIFKLDSTGQLLKRYMYNDDPAVRPEGFFQDSSRRNWRVYQTANVEYSNPMDTLVTGPFDLVNPRPYPTPWRRTVFPYRGDSVAMFRERGYYGGASFTIQGQPYWFPGTTQRFLPGVKWINHVVLEDSMVYYVAAKDSTGQDLLFRYRADSLKMEWRQTFENTLVTQKILTGKASLFLFGTYQNKYVVRRLSKDSGLLKNSFVIENPMQSQTLTLLDIGLSENRNRITAVGFLTDSMRIPENKQLWMASYDTLGNHLQTILRGGYLSWQNKTLALGIGQDGQTLTGGQLSDLNRGYAAFIYALDGQTLVQPSADTVFTVSAGNWDDLATWNTGKVPTNERHVLVLHPLTITRNIICRTLTIQSPGNINVMEGRVVEIKEL